MICTILAVQQYTTNQSCFFLQELHLRKKRAKEEEEKEEKLKNVENTSSTALLQMKARLDAMEEVVKEIAVEANKVSHSKVAIKDVEQVEKEKRTVVDGDAKQSLKTN